jgi:imidazolonepropionase-like amidohydrolase
VFRRRIPSRDAPIRSAPSSSEPIGQGASVAFEGVRLFDGERFSPGPVDVTSAGGRILAVGRALPPAGPEPAERITGGWLFPGFVDAHVHLSFSEPELLASAGVTGVLDLGAPLPYAFAEHAPLRFAASGPLITAPGGYPTTSWGAGGYGLEVRDAGQGRDAVAQLATRGAAMIKVAIEPRGGTMLDGETLRAVVEAGHEHGLKVAAHALGVDAVRRALNSGADVLAHTPTEPLPGELVAELGGRRATIVSTVRAFGGSRAAGRNLAALAGAGCPIAYGTDLGNGDIRPGIDPEELAILSEALGGVEPALASATSVAGDLAGLGGRIAAGRPSDLVWVPRFDSFDDLRSHARVWIGER